MNSRIINLGFISTFFVGCFIFFAFFYPYHLFFEEQFQLFQLNFDQFAGFFNKPAAISQYLGGFFSQFFYLIHGGAFIITGLLALLWFLVNQFTRQICKSEYFIVLSLLPSAFYWVLLCHFSFPISAVIAAILLMAILLFYNYISFVKLRMILAVLLVPVLYISIGGYAVLFAVFVSAAELKGSQSIQNLVFAVIALLLAMVFPVLLRGHFLLTFYQLWFYPVIIPNDLSTIYYMFLAFFISFVLLIILLNNTIRNFFSKQILHYSQILLISVICVWGLFTTADFELEKILALDCEAQHGRWENVVNLASKDENSNRYKAYFTNLAYSKYGQLPDNLSQNWQAGISGLFLPVSQTENFIGISFSNEVFYMLGDVNLAQHSALLGTIFSPNTVSSRLMKHLVEINIVNGQYAVAQKYIGILKNTLYHKNWAENREKLLFSDEERKKCKWLIDKRNQIPRSDTIRRSNEYEKSLTLLVKSHPDNKPALDYLLCYYLLNKDINKFMQTYQDFYKPQASVIPSLYQEAILIWLASKNAGNDQLTDYKISPEKIHQFVEYTKIYEQNSGNGQFLRADYAKTYWFYFHFATLKGGKQNE